MAGVGLVPHGARAVTVGKAVLGFVVGEKGPSEGERRARRSLEATMRLDEIETVIRHLFGGPVDTDDAEHLAPLMASAVAWKIASGAATRTPTLTRQVAEHLRYWFPLLTVGQRGEFAFKAASDRTYISADAAAQALGVTMELRTQLKLTTIGACDMTRRQRKAVVRKAKKVRDREAKTAKRRAEGIVSRDEYVGGSIAELSRKTGVSRKSLHNWRKAGVLEQKLQERGYTSVVNMHTKYVGRATPVTFGSKERDGGAPRAAVTRQSADPATSPEGSPNTMRQNQKGGSASWRTASISTQRATRHAQSER